MTKNEPTATISIHNPPGWIIQLGNTGFCLTSFMSLWVGLTSPKESWNWVGLSVDLFWWCFIRKIQRGIGSFTHETVTVEWMFQKYISQVDPISRTWSISYLDPDIPSLVAVRALKPTNGGNGRLLSFGVFVPSASCLLVHLGSFLI